MLFYVFETICDVGSKIVNDKISIEVHAYYTLQRHISETSLDVGSEIVKNRK